MISGPTGTILRDYDTMPRGSMPCLKLMDIEPYSRAKIKEFVAIKAENKSRLSDLWHRTNIPLINQGQMGWCWAFGCTNGIMLARAAENQPFLHLSPSSIAGPVSNYRNIGEPIYAALDRACSHGIADVSVYPELTTAKLTTLEVAANAARNKVQEHWDLQTYDGNPQSKSQQDFVVRLVATCLLNNIPVTVALGWWGHCVTYADVYIENGVLLFAGVNSWGSGYRYGNSPYPGWFLFPEGLGKNQATPYEAYACRVITANNPKTVIA